MKKCILKSLVSISSIIILTAGMIACSGERETTSYPVARLNPEKISPRHLLHKTNRQRDEKTTVTIQYPYANQQDIVKLRSTDAGCQLSAETGRTVFPDKYYRTNARNEIREDQSLLTSMSNEPDISLHASGLPKIATGNITRDDTISDNGKRSDNESYARQRRDTRDMNGFGIVSLATGIISLVVPYLAPVAIVFGAIGLNKRQRGLAIAGMVLGIITIVVYVAVILLFLIALSGPGI